MRLKKNFAVKNQIFRLSFCVVIYAVNAIVVGTPISITATLPQFIVLLFGIYRISGKYFDVQDMYWISSFLFFVIAPLQSLKGLGASDIAFFEWGPTERYTFLASEVYTASLIVTTFFLSTILLMRYFSWLNLSRALDFVAESQELRGSSSKLTVFFSLFIFSCVAYIIMSGGIGNVLASRYEKEREDIVKGAVVCLAFLTVSAYFFISVYLRSSQSIKLKKSPLIVVVLVLLAVFNNPFNTPRFFLIACWLPVFLMFINGRLSFKLAYLSVIFSVMFILPILSLTTRHGLDGLGDVQYSELVNNFFITPYADVFDTLVYLIRYTNIHGFNFGYNSLGIITFFIPRSVWPGKPEVVATSQIGEDLVYFAGAGTSNLSMFFAGELYMDFNLIGVIVGGLFMAALIVVMRKDHEDGRGLRSLLSYILIASLPILLRGPLMAVLALFVFQMFSFFVLLKFTRGINVFLRAPGAN